MANPDHFVFRRLSFTGPNVPKRHLEFRDGVNVVWGASNTGKSFIVKSLDFMTGAGAKLPETPEREKYDKVWLDLVLPKSGPVTLARALGGGAFELYRELVEPGAKGKPDEVLGSEHKGKKANISSFLLSEIGITDHKIATNQNGDKATFTFRHFAPYIFVEETEMMGEGSPIRTSDYASDTFDKNVLKFILTGIDDSAIVATRSAKDQKTVNTGKVELVEEWMAAAQAELERDYPDPAGLEDQYSKLSVTIDGLQQRLAERQNQLDRLRSERRRAMDSLYDTQERQTEIALALDRFEVLRSVYDNDMDRLASLDEGGAALLAGARRTCPLCGADPEHQRHIHGFEEVERARKAVKAELAKIRAERSDLAKATASLAAEHEALQRREERLGDQITSIEEEIGRERPLEASSRTEYEQLRSVRDQVKRGIRLLQRIDELRRKKAELIAFKPAAVPRGSVSVGVSGVVGFKLGQVIEEVLRAWDFPGLSGISFDGATHDILINGKSRRANGKGVRALMNAAYKVGLLFYCRRNKLPHPGTLILDSPLLTYRGPHSRHGALSADEQDVKRTSLNENFYRFLLAHADQAQFIVIENDEPPFALGPSASVIQFWGGNGEDGRQGLF